MNKNTKSLIDRKKYLIIFWAAQLSHPFEGDVAGTSFKLKYTIQQSGRGG